MKGRENWGKLRRWWAFQWFKVMRLVKKIIRSECTAHSIAMGNSIGFFVGMQPCVGSQTVAGIVLATIFRANKLATVLPCWVTNPATVIPIYAFNYWIGYLLTGWGPSQDEFKKALVDSEHIMANEGIIDGIVGAFKALMQFGPWAFLSLIIGSIIVGIAAGIVTYYPTLVLVKKIRAMRDARRQARHERVQNHLSTVIRLRDQQNQESADHPQA